MGAADAFLILRLPMQPRGLLGALRAFNPIRTVNMNALQLSLAVPVANQRAHERQQRLASQLLIPRFMRAGGNYNVAQECVQPEIACSTLHAAGTGKGCSSPLPTAWAGWAARSAAALPAVSRVSLRSRGFRATRCPQCVHTPPASASGTLVISISGSHRRIAEIAGAQVDAAAAVVARAAHFRS